MEKTEEIHVQVRVYNPLGELDWWLVHGKGDLLVSPLISGTLVNITRLKEQEAYIRKLAYIDPLTELPNRRKFKEKLEDCIRI